MGHLSKLQDEFGKKGLNVIAINGESKDVHLRYMVHNDPGFRYKLAIGSGNEYGVSGIPHAYLIDPEGKVVWEGSPSSMSAKKDLLPVLKMVREPTEDETAERAQKSLQWAEAFAADGLVLRAEAAFEKVVDLYPKTAAAETAKERAAAMSEGDNATEYKAQEAIAKVVGGIEGPDPTAKKMKGKIVERNVGKLQKLADSFAEDAPRAQKLAEEWAGIFANPWQ